MKIRFLALLLSTTFVTITLAACGGSEATPASSADASESTEHAAPAPAAAEIPEGAKVIQPDGDMLAFKTTEFSVRAGEEVTLVFQNTAKSAAMSHNVLVLKTTDAVNRVGQASMAAGPARDYIPDDDAIIAATPLAAPGETVQVTFTAPAEPGDYPYICTFAGHYMAMRGTMKVTS